MDVRTWRWWVIRLELAIATATPILIALLALAAPGFVGVGPWHGSFFGPPGNEPYAVAFGVSLVGATWAWRIWLADLEAGAPRWRYRARC